MIYDGGRRACKVGVGSYTGSKKVAVITAAAFCLDATLCMHMHTMEQASAGRSFIFISPSLFNNAKECTMCFLSALTKIRWDPKVQYKSVITLSDKARNQLKRGYNA